MYMCMYVCGMCDLLFYQFLCVVHIDIRSTVHKTKTRNYVHCSSLLVITCVCMY